MNECTNTLNYDLNIVFVFSVLIGGNTCEESAVSSVAIDYSKSYGKPIKQFISNQFISRL